jgi:hypothetical protein
MGIALSTAGVTVGYAVETVKGTRPVSGYKLIPDIKEVPEMNPEPETLETTTLAETEYKTYIEGLKDLGGALAFTANYTTEVETVWAELVEEYKTAIDSGLATWFEIKHPKLDKSVFFTGQPSAMGLPAMSVNSVLETSLYITPTSAPQREAKSTNE